jgi:ribosome-binding protein aMBF1 (putative translation factor)
MSVPMKMPLTDVIIDGQIFHVHKQHKGTLLTIVKKFSVEPENPFENLESKYPSYAICLKGARGKAGLSQKELSQKTGIAITNISKMENGQRRIGLKIAKKLAKALGVGYKIFLEDKK